MAENPGLHSVEWKTGAALQTKRAQHRIRGMLRRLTTMISRQETVLLPSSLRHAILLKATHGKHSNPRIE